MATDYANIYENYKVSNFDWLNSDEAHTIRVESISYSAAPGYAIVTDYIYTPIGDSGDYNKSKSEKSIISISGTVTIKFNTVNSLAVNGIKLYPLKVIDNNKVQQSYHLYAATDGVVTIPSGYYLNDGIEISYKGGMALAYQWKGKPVDTTYFNVDSDFSGTDTTNNFKRDGTITPTELIHLPSSTIKKRYEDFKCNEKVFKTYKWPKFLINNLNLQTVTSVLSDLATSDDYQYNTQSIETNFGTTQQYIPVSLGTYYSNEPLQIPAELKNYLRSGSHLTFYNIKKTVATSSATISGKRDLSGNVKGGILPTSGTFTPEPGWNQWYSNRCMVSYLQLGATSQETPFTMQVDVTFKPSYTIYKYLSDDIMAAAGKKLEDLISITTTDNMNRVPYSTLVKFYDRQDIYKYDNTIFYTREARNSTYLYSALAKAKAYIDISYEDWNNDAGVSKNGYALITLNTHNNCELRLPDKTSHIHDTNNKISHDFVSLEVKASPFTTTTNIKFYISDTDSKINYNLWSTNNTATFWYITASSIDTYSLVTNLEIWNEHNSTGIDGNKDDTGKEMLLYYAVLWL